MSGPGYMAWVRKCYGVPAKRGMLVVIQTGRFDQHSGTILSATPNAHLRVRVFRPTEKQDCTCTFHPSDLEYRPDDVPLPRLKRSAS